MTKKRIADLLKEEVEKAERGAADDTPVPESSAAESQTTQAKKPTSRRARSGSKPTSQGASPKADSKAANKTANKTANKVVDNPADSASAKGSDKATSEAIKQPDPAMAKKLAELTTALEAAQAQVNSLQTDVETHQNRIFELKDELTQAQQIAAQKAQQLAKLTQEYEEAKATIRQLTEAASAAADQQAKPSDRPPASPPEPSRQSLTLRRAPYAERGIPEYAIQRDGDHNQSMLSDDDIGWVD